jgi:hypothetical protein
MTVQSLSLLEERALLAREEQERRNVHLRFRIAHPPGVLKVDPGSLSTQTKMAWRPYENLIDGELDNRRPGRVTGWLRFFRRGKPPLWVRLDLAGDFREDIRGKAIHLVNSQSSDRNQALERKGTYMDGFSEVQRGIVGDITAGLALGHWTQELAQKLVAQNELVWNEMGLEESERARRRQEFAERYRS